jgi:hypothetical protein
VETALCCHGVTVDGFARQEITFGVYLNICRIDHIFSVGLDIISTTPQGPIEWAGTSIRGLISLVLLFEAAALASIQLRSMGDWPIEFNSVWNILFIITSHHHFPEQDPPPFEVSHGILENPAPI